MLPLGVAHCCGEWYCRDLVSPEMRYDCDDTAPPTEDPSLPPVDRRADLYKMSSRSKWMTVQEARDFITDHDSEIEEEVSEDEDDLELNSDSNRSDC
ncbi:unnamed protein product [Arctogadus glacialis]